MIEIDDCRNCIHKRPLKDGWKFCCDAFLEGSPLGFEFGLVKDMKECNNGIGYEEKEAGVLKEDQSIKDLKHI